jgi:hypothetical protein
MKLKKIRKALKRISKYCDCRQCKFCGIKDILKCNILEDRSIEHLPLLWDYGIIKQKEKQDEKASENNTDV